jgi:aspartate aminotransferase
LALLAEIPGLRCNKPLGAFYLFPEVRDYFGCTNGKTTIHNADDLCIYLLREAHVSVVTGSAFGAPSCIRISYAIDEEQLQIALQRMKEALLKLTKAA